ncbi:Patatin [Neochlamydia sp. TUME1]|uniref:patatin-like phospholipase family protein n=1 Tax=Neochlamydia sp. TUME1 TaxID=1478174 RepID=UPI00057EE73D|nr:patatin-like phospholipase family protein [Neochlamydia sp. TUME1]KIC75888.1 Patatin [Neochlamydia sp. TUME1]
MTSEVQQSSTSILSWSIDLLEEKCKTINKSMDESRHIKYTQILQCFQNDMRAITDERDLAEFTKRFSIIKNNIPNEIKEGADFALYLGKTDKKINDCLRIVEQLKSFQRDIKEAKTERDLAHLDMSITKVERQITSNLLPIYKGIIEECRESYISSLDKKYFQKKPSPIQKKSSSEGDDPYFEREDSFSFAEEFSSDFVVQESRESIASYTRGKKRKSIYPILSLDGGGIRGIIPATMLVAIEEITRKPIAKLFKLIGGTSTGGILALGLSKPDKDDPRKPQYKAKNLLDMYTKEYAGIFQPNQEHLPMPKELGSMQKIMWFLKNIKGMLDNPKYKDPSEFFKDKLGERTSLSSALTKVVVITNTYDEILRKSINIGKKIISGESLSGSAPIDGSIHSIISHDDISKTVHLYTSEGMKIVSYCLQDLKAKDLINLPPELSCVNSYDFPMHHVATVTSAAPTYFPPVVVNYNVTESTQGKESWFMDGGVLQNNPALPCVFEALGHKEEDEDLFVLSLGTGGKDSMLPKGYEDLADMWSDMTQPYFETHNIVSYMIGANNYHRFQYEFDKPAPPLDDTSLQTIQFLKTCGENLVKENYNSIRNICKVLSPESFQDC